MIVHGIVLAIAGPFILVLGIILLEPLPVALGAMASACAAWIIGDEARWWRELLGQEPRARREQRRRWPLVVLGGFVALSAVVVLAKARQGLLRPGDVALLVGWVAILSVVGWHTRADRPRGSPPDA